MSVLGCVAAVIITDFHFFRCLVFYAADDSFFESSALLQARRQPKLEPTQTLNQHYFERPGGADRAPHPKNPNAIFAGSLTRAIMKESCVSIYSKTILHASLLHFSSP